MNEPIIVDVQYTAEDLARGAKYVGQRNVLVKYAFFLPLVILSVILLMAFSLKRGSFTPEQQKNLILVSMSFLTVGGMIFFIGRTKYSRIVRNQFQKQIDSSPALQQPKTIIFDENGISGQSSLGAGETRWEAVIEAAETPDDFYFFTAKRFAQFVPKRAFLNDGQQDKLKFLARSRLGERAKL
jgi:hypothetical protein